MRNKFFTILCLLCLGVSAYAQNNSLIIKYQVKNSLWEKEYYWIVPDSTIGKKGSFKAYPLYINQFSKNNFEICLNGNSVDLFTATEESSYDFEEDFENNLQLLQKLVSESKNLVQVIRKKSKKLVTPKEKVYISVTPIEGQFVYCPTTDRMKKTIRYDGKIALPAANFKIDMPYYNSKKISDFLFYADFSLFNYYNDIE